MRVPLEWIARYVRELPATEEVAHRLTMGGLEVESIEAPQGTYGEHLVFARIESFERHPDADKLNVCQVNDGSEIRTIVCGAPNVRRGATVVLARPGAVLPGGLKIKPAKLRGVRSEGMLCSAEELGLADDVDGILLVEPEQNPGDPAAGFLGLDAATLELGITPNRGDCLSIRGIARDLAAVCDLARTEHFDAMPESVEGAGQVRIEIDDPAACSLYRGIEIADVRVESSPTWLKVRLARCGLRPINNIVDVTNLVLLEFGQPLHAFDRDLLAGSTVRVARAGGQHRTMTTLDGQDVNLESEDLLILDGVQPVALAGVMGGAATAVHAGTRNVFLEAAVFEPSCVRRTSRRLGLISESSYRFERGIDASMTCNALLVAARLIAELGRGRLVGGVCASASSAPEPKVVPLRPQRIVDLLGYPVDSERASQLLRRLDCRILDGDARCLRVEIPAHRHDIEREVDLIEEVARLEGYDRIPATLPSAAMMPVEVPARVRWERDVRTALAANGLCESVGLVFTTVQCNELLPGLHPRDAGSVVVRNPMRADECQLRRSLLATLIPQYGANLRNGIRSVDLFTIGRTFCDRTEGGELETVAGLLAGPRRGRQPADVDTARFWDAKGVIERMLRAPQGDTPLRWLPEAQRCEYHPKASARLVFGEDTVGYLGLIHPFVAEALDIPEEICVFEIDSRLALLYASRQPRLSSVARYPGSSRDVSLLVPVEMLAGEILERARELREALLEDVRVFEDYRGKGVPEGFKALAFSVSYRAADRTLTDEEISVLHDRVVGHLTQMPGISVRA